jgi:hypothetical protein
MKQLLIGAILFAAPYANAGGCWFMTSIGQPEAHGDARAHSAAFTVGVYGCSANDTEVIATAEGLVNGVRRSVPIQVVRLNGGRKDAKLDPKTGAIEDWPNYAVAVPKTWPDGGTWMIRVETRTSSKKESALVVLGPDGVNRAATQMRNYNLKDSDVETALRLTASATVTQVASAGK